MNYIKINWPSAKRVQGKDAVDLRTFLNEYTPIILLDQRYHQNTIPNIILKVNSSIKLLKNIKVAFLIL